MNVFDYGDSVRIAASAPAKQRPGSFGSICGIRTVPKDNAPNAVLYLVEFGDGFSIEIAGEHLERDERTE